MNKVYILLIIYLFGAILAAQNLDTIVPPDSVRLLTSPTDSLILRNGDLVLVSPDSIDVPVDYGSDDSVRFDYKNKIIHLYGNAFIHYKLMDIKADYIRIEMNENLAIALPLIDTTGKKTGVPEFKEGEQNFKAQKISYNFKTKKGSIEEVITKEGDLYIHGESTKFISRQSKDSNGDDIIYNQNALITSCDAEHPHFGIRSNKQKVIPNKLVVVGSSNVVINGIPTPLWLPFGFFPISKNARSGILFPKRYEYDDRGFGLADIGYYWPVSDHLDLKFLVDIFFKGSFKLNLDGNYKTKYKYGGNFALQFENRIQEVTNDYRKNINRPISLRWNHNQESGAHPYQSFGGSMNVETNGFSKLSVYDQRAFENILRSSFNYSYSFPNSPFSLSAAMSHSQNTNTHDFNITLPELNVQMRTITPFKSKNSISQTDRWYHRINMSYNAQIRNTLNTKDTILFTSQALDKLDYGFRHNANLNATFKLLRYFNVTPSISYNEEITFYSQELQLKNIIFYDTTLKDTVYGLEEQILQKGIFPFRTFTTSASFDTKLFGQILSSKGWFRGIRHQLTPSFSFNFSPDYHKQPFHYFKSVDTDLRDSLNKKKEYLIFAKSPFGSPGIPNENFNISFRLNNQVEMKYYSKKDTVAKKIALIEGFSLSGNYNVFADSFKLSTISGSGSNRFFKGLVTLYYGLSIDPYGRELINGKEVRQKDFALKQNKKLAYVTNSFLNISSGLSVGQLVELINKELFRKRDPARPALQELFYDFNIQYNINFRHTRLTSGKDTIQRSVHNISLSGNIPLTSNWKVNINNVSYNFDQSGIQYPSLGLERDLHCWVMKFDWSPQLGYYSFTLGVKPGSLDFIRIPNNQSFSGASR